MTAFLSRLFRPLSTSSAPAYAVTPRKDIIMPDNAQKATLAAGCFWGVEHIFLKHYPISENKGILQTAVGYTGGKEDVTNPSYRLVCTGTTDPAEALRIKDKESWRMDTNLI